MFLSAVLAVIALCIPRGAHADKVTNLISQLTGSSNYKVRLSAALNLAKLNDPRSIPAFIKALKDKDKTVRGVAAASLGKIIDGNTPKSRRTSALKALKRAASRDKNAFVRKQAQKAYDSITALSGGGAKNAKIYVNIGGMSAKSSKMKGLMVKTAKRVFAKKGRSMTTSWAGGKAPSKKQIRKKKMKAFHVSGTLEALKTSKSGSSSLISCKVRMILASYPEKSMFGFLDGGAKVQAGTSSRDIEFAKEDCVAAVVESLVGSKIIPTIKTRAK